MGIFKAYDIRGKHPEEISEETAYRIGRAFVELLNVKSVVVGRDCRLSSPKLCEALCNGITEQGADVVDIGLSTTPMMYFSVIKLKADSGIIVTASHNPKEHNGFKLVGKGAAPVTGENGIYKMEELVSANKFSQAKNKGRITKKETVNEYVESTFKFVDTKKIKPFKIVLDTANGMAGLVLPKLFEKTSCAVISMFPELNGAFPNHQPDPLQEKLLEPLRKRVVKEKADLGIAADGDFDRIKFVDEKGEIVQNDLMTALLSKIFLSEKKGLTIMYDLRSSRIVRETIEQNKGKAIKYRVGHSYIKQKMAEEDIFFSGELSGHYYLKLNNNMESPMIIMLYLLKYLSEQNKRLSEAILPFRKYFHSGELNFEVEDKDAAMDKVEKAFSDVGQIQHIDGLSVECKDFWLNLRPSNTEPLLRLNAEATTKKQLKDLIDKVSGLIT